MALRLVFLLSLALLPLRADAASITYAGRTFDSVDWGTASTTTNIATGVAAGVAVTFQALDLFSTSIDSADYTTDPAFDALGFPAGGELERIELYGALTSGSSDVLSFDQPVVAVLMIIGSPDVATDPFQYGPSLWDFDDSLSVSVVDTEAGALAITAGNVLDNINAAGPGNHASGVVLIEGPFTTLEWLQAFPTGNSDRMKITFAIAVPEPGIAALLALGLLAIGRRRAGHVCGLTFRNS